VIRRNGDAVAFNPEKISIAISKAFLSVAHGQTAFSSRMREQVTLLTQTVVSALIRRLPSGGSVHIEDVQDQVELALMRSGEHDVAKAYVLYREKHAAERAGQAHDTPQIHIMVNGNRQPLDVVKLTGMAIEACLGLGAEVSPERVVEQAVRDCYDGI
jgi:ribonucleoside-diphosphate reductase alpha chain